MPEGESDTPQPLWAKNMESRLREEIRTVGKGFLYDSARIIGDIEAAAVSIVQQLQPEPTPANPGPATGLGSNIGGNSMASISVSVDLAGENYHIDWLDDKLEPTTDYPAGATLTATSSSTSVATLGTPVVDEAGSGVDIPLSFFLAGTTSLVGAALDSTGTPIPGFTTSDTLTLTPGPAASLLGSVNGSVPPVPVPVSVSPSALQSRAASIPPVTPNV